MKTLYHHNERDDADGDYTHDEQENEQTEEHLQQAVVPVCIYHPRRNAREDREGENGAEERQHSASACTELVLYKFA